MIEMRGGGEETIEIALCISPAGEHGAIKINPAFADIIGVSFRLRAVHGLPAVLLMKLENVSEFVGNYPSRRVHPQTVRRDVQPAITFWVAAGKVTAIKHGEVHLVFLPITVCGYP